MTTTKEIAVSNKDISELDELYNARTKDGYPACWGTLVEELRALRRKVESGSILVLPDGIKLRTWNEFYTWAHGRYHALEDGYDSWIGDDNS